MGLTSAELWFKRSQDDMRRGRGDLTLRLLLIEILRGTETVLGELLTLFGATTNGLGLAERMSMSGPSSMMVSRNERRLGSSRTCLSFCGVSPICHGGVPPIWQQRAYMTPSVSLTSGGARVTEMSVCRIA